MTFLHQLHDLGDVDRPEQARQADEDARCGHPPFDSPWWQDYDEEADWLEAEVAYERSQDR